MNHTASVGSYSILATAKQLEYVIKDHIAMHTILLNLKWLYSLVS